MIIVAEQNAIPKQQHFQYRAPCAVAHPGFCRHRDEQLLQTTVPMMSNFATLFRNLDLVFKFIDIRATRTDAVGESHNCYWDTYAKKSFLVVAVLCGCSAVHGSAVGSSGGAPSGLELRGDAGNGIQWQEISSVVRRVKA